MMDVLRLLEFCGLLFPMRKAQPCTREAVVRSRVELLNRNGLATVAFEDDVGDLIVELGTEGFSLPSHSARFLELGVSMGGLESED